jgi:NRAMP (natural resistance-associated macrophage protein)-like metal ion transporter
LIHDGASVAILESQGNISTIRGALQRMIGRLGPGLITGAADDDPSGIGTYSQAGAQIGYNIGWTMLLTCPLMVAIQEISARIGRTTGHGIAGNLRRFYPNWLLQIIVLLLFVANTINIGADLSAMADATYLLIGGQGFLYVLLFCLLCTLGIVFLNYRRYVIILKWLTLTLFAYVAALFATNLDWRAALSGALYPHVRLNGQYFTTLVAILGTTISPYLFFWQASEEAEDLHIDRRRRSLLKAPRQASDAFNRIRADTLVGMVLSNTIALAIIFTTAATLNKAGVMNIETATQASEALKPIAGVFAFAVFTLGIVATGLLAIPVLAGSAAYAVGEGRRWPVGLARQPREAVAFYSVLAAATALGALITLSPVDPIKALYWSAVINGVVAVPVMTVMMFMTCDQRVMGQFMVRGTLRWLGWASTAAMAVCVAAMIAYWLV